MRRLMAACGAAALSLAVVVPVALAAVPNNQNSGQQLQFYTPQKYGMNGNAQPQADTPPDGSSVFAGNGATCQYGSNQCEITVQAHLFSSADSGQPGGGVKAWKIVIQPAGGGAPSTCAETISPANGTYQDDAYLLCPWDTTRAVDRTLPDGQTTPTGTVGDQNFQRNWVLADHGPAVNGPYTIQVTVWSAGQHCVLGLCSVNPSKDNGTDYELYQDPAAQHWRQVYVVNGVAAPTGVNATFDQPSNRINVTWAPNPEPDVSYLVQEKVGGGNWAPIATVPGSATNYVRTVGQPGQYQYQVAAMRPAPTAGNPSATKTSNYVAAQAVTVNAVSPPTTAAPGSSADPGGAPAGPDGPSGFIDHSGDNGVVASGAGSTSTTAVGSHVPGSAKGTPAGAHSSGSKSASGGSAAGDGEADGEGPDTGFSSTLPYTQDGSADGLGSGNEESPESMSKLVNVPRPQDARALLIPLAGALAMFVLAAQGMYLLRRRAPVGAGGVAIEDDFDDWMGY